MQSWRCAVAWPRYTLSIRLCRIRPTAFTRRGGGLATKFPFSPRLINDPACVCPPPPSSWISATQKKIADNNKMLSFFQNYYYSFFPTIFPSVLARWENNQPIEMHFSKDSETLLLFLKDGRAREFPPQSIWWNPHQLTSRERERVCVRVSCARIPRAGGIDPFATGAIRSVPSLSYSFLPHPIKENQEFGLYNFLIPWASRIFRRWLNSGGLYSRWITTGKEIPTMCGGQPGGSIKVYTILDGWSCGPPGPSFFFFLLSSSGSGDIYRDMRPTRESNRRSPPSILPKNT
jgi:hypothetical protein